MFPRPSVSVNIRSVFVDRNCYSSFNTTELQHTVTLTLKLSSESLWYDHLKMRLGAFLQCLNYPEGSSVEPPDAEVYSREQGFEKGSGEGMLQ